MATIKGLNAHDRPPEKVRDVYKKYLKIKLAEVDHDEDIVDLEKLDVDNLPSPFAISGFLDSKDLRLAFDEFVGGSGNSSSEGNNHGGVLIEDIPILTHEKVSGKSVPSLLFECRVTKMYCRAPYDTVSISTNSSDQVARLDASPGSLSPRTSNKSTPSL